MSEGHMPGYQFQVTITATDDPDRAHVVTIANGLGIASGHIGPDAWQAFVDAIAPESALVTRNA